MKKMFCIMLSLLLTLSLFSGCGGNTADGKTSEKPSAPSSGSSETSAPDGAAGTDFSQKVVLKVADILPDKQIQNVVLLEIEEEITKRSNGAITFENYLTGTLGTVKEMAEALVIGSCDLAMITNATVASYIPTAAINDLPFLYRDYDHALAAIPAYQDEIFKDSENTLGTYICTFIMGYNQMCSNIAPIETMDDLYNLKVRVNQSQLHIDTFNALGANATPIAGSEMYAALQQGVVDANVNTINTFASEQYWDIQKYVTTGVNCFLGTTSWFMSNSCRDKLPEGYADLIFEVFKEHLPDLYERVEKTESENLDILKEKMEVNVLAPEERERMVDAVSGVWETHGESIGLDLIEKVANYEG
ncbi:MAG: TRAP transporter substrate-binding protein [Oscillospiraceae bacterium]